MDIGFINRGDGIFVGTASSKTGALNIFDHDFVVRMHERYAHHQPPELLVRTIGNKAIGENLCGALSVGPMIDDIDFTNNPVNRDKSLGSKPSFLKVPLARTALYETAKGIVHMRLFDGRPGSSTFPGVTPIQASEIIKKEGDIMWGCFLDGGQTSKLVVRTSDAIASLGNTHYLKWPTNQDEKYVWVPKTGRPVASTIALRQAGLNIANLVAKSSR